jgi:hypothetical protein
VALAIGLVVCALALLVTLTASGPTVGTLRTETKVAAQSDTRQPSSLAAGSGTEAAAPPMTAFSSAPSAKITVAVSEPKRHGSTPTEKKPLAGGSPAAKDPKSSRPSTTTGACLRPDTAGNLRIRPECL